jgi:hypothetical protein
VSIKFLHQLELLGRRFSLPKIKSQDMAVALRAKRLGKKALGVAARLHATAGKKPVGAMATILQWSAFGDIVASDVLGFDEIKSFLKVNGFVPSYQELIGKLVLPKLRANPNWEWETVSLQTSSRGESKFLMGKFGTNQVLFAMTYGRGGKDTFSYEPWYHSEHFEMSEVVEAVWEEEHMFLQLPAYYDDQRLPTLTPRPRSKDPLSGKSSVNQFHALCEMFNREPTGSILVGKPGTGKTQSVAYAALATNKKLLTVEIAYGAKDNSALLELFQQLRPDVIFLDDIDHAYSQEGLFQLIDCLRRLSIHIVMAVNNASLLDEALWRPGRIEHLFQFELPDEADRQKIMESYAESFKVEVPSHFAKNTEGYSGAFLRELIRRLRFESPDRILEQVALIKGLSVKKEKEKEAVAATPAPIPAPVVESKPAVKMLLSQRKAKAAA